MRRIVGPVKEAKLEKLIKKKTTLGCRETTIYGLKNVNEEV